MPNYLMEGLDKLIPYYVLSLQDLGIHLNIPLIFEYFLFDVPILLYIKWALIHTMVLHLISKYIIYTLVR